MQRKGAEQKEWTKRRCISPSWTKLWIGMDLGLNEKYLTYPILIKDIIRSLWTDDKKTAANLMVIPHLDIPPFLRIIQVNRRAYKGNDRGKYVGRCRQRGAGNAETRARPKPTEVPSRAVQVNLQ